MALKLHSGAFAGFAAAASMAATPAFAADIPAAGPVAELSSQALFTDFDQSRYDPASEVADNHRYRRYRHRNRVDAGDVLTGVLIIGGIAAIASAASKDNDRDRERERERDWERERQRDRDYRDYDRRYDRGYETRRDAPRGNSAAGIESAVDQCVSQIERDVRVDTVDGVGRTADGWIVSGTLFNGSNFTCRIGSDGDVSDIDYSGFSGVSYDGPSTDNRARGDQWSDASYAAARQSVGMQRPTSQSAVANPDEPLPAYPGGPLPGEDTGEIDGDLGG